MSFFSLLARPRPSTWLTTSLALASLAPGPRTASADPASPDTPARRGRIAASFEAPAGQRPTTFPTFNPDIFTYDKHPRPVIWATPTALQTMVFGRPPVNVPTPPANLQGTESVPNTDLPTPRTLVNVDLRWFAFQSEGGEWIPALLATPAGKTGPFPLVVATHGLLSHKMQVVSQVAPDLTAREFAVVAIDLPLHGEREGMAANIVDPKNPLGMSQTWRRAVINLRQAIDVASTFEIIDARQPILAMGYSLGSWMTTILGAADPRISAIALLVGGATDLSADMLTIPAIASSDPRVAVAAFAPRPVLMLNASNDKTVTPEMARRLFSAAREPKEQRWYETGHILKAPAFKDLADWLVAQREKSSHPAGG